MKMATLEFNAITGDDMAAWQNVSVGSQASYRDVFSKEYLNHYHKNKSQPVLPYMVRYITTAYFFTVSFHFRDYCYADLYYNHGVMKRENLPINWYYESWEHRGLRGSGKIAEHPNWNYVDVSEHWWGNLHTWWFDPITPDWYPFYFSVRTFNSIPIEVGSSGIYCAARYLEEVSPGVYEIFEKPSLGYQSLPYWTFDYQDGKKIPEELPIQFNPWEP